jgi:hypothetical protein
MRTATGLEPQERDALLAALTPKQNAYLLEHDYVFVEGVGVLWKPPHGESLRRASFTHGAHFETQYGGFYIDSRGIGKSLQETEP